ncbi:MAG TPA: Asp-tRNA(Asn)/Glu-tRNA(Gln) amidotransferase subunit GatC [Polyangiaceae bacterium]|nr:Asp-tRNA(Asn)/Glu-tRNA(Gln) amidotransferase subunit GatC [Polyangiaceae bacterium]
MALSRADVLHIAELADLALTDDEVTQLTRDLGAVLQHVAQLEELDTTQVPLTTHVGVAQMPLRADNVVAGLGQDAALGSAPRAYSGAFAVPKFMDE